MSARQVRALSHFESFYAALGEALDDEDAELVAELVGAREDALAELLTAFEGSCLPDSMRAHIEGSEAHIHSRVVRFYDQLLMRVAEQEHRSYAAVRYQEGAR